jgi:hypothetical protein
MGHEDSHEKSYEEEPEEWLQDESGAGADEGEEGADIQALLDLGYEQLDGFVQWEEEALALGTRIPQQDAYNAEQLIDYLANHQHKGVSEIDEFDLRWFLFSHYIRKAQADPETEERLPDSLTRFFGYLKTQHSELEPSWLQGVLDDRGYYLQRRHAYHELDQADEQEWEIGFQEWCRDLEDDLDTRCLWLPRDMGEGMEWSPVMGWREATLQAEANREWQTGRDRLLRQGLNYDVARDQLAASYYIWLDTPQKRLGDLSPREVILAERADRSEDEEEN